MRKADVIGNPTLMKIYQAKQDRRKARREAQKAEMPTLKGKEGASVRKVFETVLEGMKKEAEANLTRHYVLLADEAKAVEGLKYDAGHLILNKKRGLQWGNSYYPTDATRFQYNLFESSSMSLYRPLIMKPATEVKKLIDRQVADEVYQMFESFIRKQTEKINGILKGRKAKIHSKVYANLEGTFDFVLDDGSKFLMKTQVVWKMSPKGKRFWQFPTTFHNAVKADGQPIRQPSEMNLKKEL